MTGISLSVGKTHNSYSPISFGLVQLLLAFDEGHSVGQFKFHA